MILEAYAKINWSLDITGMREDGYHLMDMIMQPVSLCDEIILQPAASISITTGGRPLSRADETNLAYRAASELKKESGYPYGVSIHIQKQIPIGAGMGGGSADAAAVLVGLNQMWNTSLPSDELERIGLKLGADVPFFIRGGLTRTRGIGDVLENHDYRYNYWLVIIQPCPGLSTAQVFSLWHMSNSAVRPDTAEALNALSAGNLSSLCEHIGNVLQPVSEKLRPQIRDACNVLSDHGALFAGMTGSGSAVFGVFRSFPLANKAFLCISKLYKSSFLCHTQHDSIRILT